LNYLIILANYIIIAYSDPFLIGRSSRRVKLIPLKLPGMVAETRKFDTKDCKTILPIDAKEDIKGYLVIGNTKIRHFKYKKKDVMVRINNCVTNLLTNKL
jgi:hypothetical protein